MDVYQKLKTMKLLLIDDDEWIRDSMQMLFESEGCQLTVLETAEEGIMALEQDSYDLVIADYKLLGMDGITFLKQTQTRQPQTIQILITAHADDELMAKLSQANIRYLIKKPFSSQIIESVLTQALEAT